MEREKQRGEFPESAVGPQLAMRCLHSPERRVGHSCALSRPHIFDSDPSWKRSAHFCLSLAQKNQSHVPLFKVLFERRWNFCTIPDEAIVPNSRLPHLSDNPIMLCAICNSKSRGLVWIPAFFEPTCGGTYFGHRHSHTRIFLCLFGTGIADCRPSLFAEVSRYIRFHAQVN